MSLKTDPDGGKRNFTVPRQSSGRSVRVYFELACIVFFWALNWPFMKYAVRHAAALDFVFLRLVGAAIMMVVVSLLMKAPVLPERGERAGMAWIGVWQVGVMLAPSVIGLQFVGPGRAAVLVYTMQLWALPLGWLIAKDRITVTSAVGSLIGFGGLMLYLNPALVNWHDRKVLLGNALVLSSGVGWAIGASLYRRSKWKTPVWTQTTWQVIWGAIAIIGPCSLLSHHHVEWTTGFVGVLLFNWVVSTALCYWWWSRALTEMPASRAGQIVSLVPVLALIMSSVWTGEPLTAMVFGCMALITTGIVLTIRGRDPDRTAEAPTVTSTLEV